MNRLLLMTLILAGMAAPWNLQAHDPSKHKGKATEGEILSVAADRFELKTAAGNTTVLLTDKTKIEHGDQAVAKDHLKQGLRVSVFGTKLPTGELAAREIVLSGKTAHAKH